MSEPNPNPQLLWSVESLTRLIPGMKAHLRGPQDYDAEGVNTCLLEFFESIRDNQKSLLASDAMVAFEKHPSAGNTLALFEKIDALQADWEALKIFMAVAPCFTYDSLLLYPSSAASSAIATEAAQFSISCNNKIIAPLKGLPSEALEQLEHCPEIAPYRATLKKMIASGSLDVMQKTGLMNHYMQLGMQAQEMLQGAEDPTLSDNARFELLIQSMNASTHIHMLYAQMAGHADMNAMSQFSNGYDRRLIEPAIAAIAHHTGEAIPLMGALIQHGVKPANFDLYNISVEHAKELIMGAYERLSPEYGAIARQAFDEQWIHLVTPNPEDTNQVVGGFMLGGIPTKHAPHAHPFVYSVYGGTIETVFLIAHEMGHAIADHLACQTNAQLAKAAKIGVHEIFSHLGEAFLYDELKERFADPEQQLQIDLAYAERKFMNLDLATLTQAGIRFNAIIEGEHRDITTQETAAIIDAVQSPYPPEQRVLKTDFLKRYVHTIQTFAIPYQEAVYPIDQLIVEALHDAYHRNPQHFASALQETMRAGNRIELQDAIERLTGELHLSRVDFFETAMQSLLYEFHEIDRRGKALFPVHTPGSDDDQKPVTTELRPAVETRLPTAQPESEVPATHDKKKGFLDKLCAFSLRSDDVKADRDTDKDRGWGRGR